MKIEERGILRFEICLLRLKWWEVLVTLQFVASDTYLLTLDLQSSSRITSRKRNDECLTSNDERNPKTPILSFLEFRISDFISHSTLVIRI